VYEALLAPCGVMDGASDMLCSVCSALCIWAFKETVSWERALYKLNMSVSFSSEKFVYFFYILRVYPQKIVLSTC
jgi:hypothetical protein